MPDFDYTDKTPAQQAVVAAGYTMAAVRWHDRVELSAVCRGDEPGDWRLCLNGRRGDDGWCALLYGDICRPAKQLAKQHHRARVDEYHRTLVVSQMPGEQHA